MINKFQTSLTAMLLAGMSILFSVNAKAQSAFGIGAGASIFSPRISSTAGGTTTSTTMPTDVGFAIRPYWNINDKMRVDVNFSLFYGASKSRQYTTVNDNGINGSVTYTTLNVSETYNFLNIGANYQYAFIGQYRESFVFYGLAGLGMITATHKISPETGTDAINNSNTSIGVNLGIGAELPLGSCVSIYLEPRYTIALTGGSENLYSTTYTKKVGGFNADLGVRFTFGGK